jgi:hypothetical protein
MCVYDFWGVNMCIYDLRCASGSTKSLQRVKKQARSTVMYMRASVHVNLYVYVFMYACIQAGSPQAYLSMYAHTCMISVRI